MRKDTNRLAGKSLITLLLMAFFISATSSSAVASEGSGDTKSGAGTTGQISEAAAVISHSEPDCVQTSSESKQLTVAYVLYTGAFKLTPETAAVPVSAPISGVAAPRTSALPLPLPLPLPAASTAPMTAGEKFTAYFKKTFLSPGAYAQSIFSGLFNELRDKKDKPDFDTGDYFGDAMTRAARSHAFKITAGFFEKFAFPTIFKQDPRYHRSDKSGTGGKLAYAVSRLFVTQGDRSGDQINASYLLGAAVGSGLANYWEREDRRDLNHSLRRFGVHLGLTAFSNILREFIGGQ